MLYQAMLKMDESQLLREAASWHQQEVDATAQLLVRLAAVEARGLFAPAGYASMWDYCLHELRMSEESAGRRLWASRKCTEFPALFDALAHGRLNLTAIHLLSTHLTNSNVDALIDASAGRTKAEIQELLAARFPRPSVPTSIRPVVRRNAGVPASSPTLLNPTPNEGSHSLASVPVPSDVPDAPKVKEPLAPRSKVEPLDTEHVRIEFTCPKRVREKLEHALDLLGTRVAPKDLGALLEMLLDLGIPVFEKQKFAATGQARESSSAKADANPRVIPAHVKREVWKRDGAQCTFRNARGQRCTCRRGLEFDHVRPVALGGKATLDNVRLLCRTHNQLEAERRLGKAFLASKRPLRRSVATRGARALSRPAAVAPGTSAQVPPH